MSGSPIRKPRRATRVRAGMTLVEILAVVVILGLLAAILAVNFSGSFGKAKQELARTGIGQIAQRLELYKIETGRFPGNEQGLGSLSSGGTDTSFYLEKDKLLDPWGRPYWYLTPGPDGLPYEVLTYGADGEPGGEGENADVSSANMRGEE